MLYKIRMHITCADPGIFVRGGGGPGQSDKKSSDNFFFFFFLSSAYSTEVKWLISKKTIIFQGSRGVQLFPGGGGGSNCLFPIETHITCDFPGGVRTPCSPPLDPHLYNNNLSNLSSIKKTAFTDFKKEFVNRIREKEKRK